MKHHEKTEKSYDFLSTPNRKNRVRSVLLSMFLLFITSASAQDPKVLTDWTALEEAEYLVDVSFQVVQCDEESSPIILFNVFNEGGIKTEIGFTLSVTDLASGSAQDVEVGPLAVPQANMFISSCNSDDYPALKVAVPEGFDGSNLSIEITYN